MMRIDYTIHKAEFEPTDKLELLVPIGSTVKYIGEQEHRPGAIQVWYERPVPVVEGEGIVIELYCFGTGHVIDVVNTQSTYFQTVLMSNGLVWHFYISYPEVTSVND